MKTYFYLPDHGNRITANDIQKGLLRITVHAKPFFSGADDIVRIQINGVTREVSYKKRINRSDVLYIGTDTFDLLSITEVSILKFTKQSSNEFLLENSSTDFIPSYISKINYDGLHALKQHYLKLLDSNPFPQPPVSGRAIEMIKYFKRKIQGVEQIGPCRNLSVFEAANRIATDLVILNGVIQIIDEELEPKTSIISLCLGNHHEKGKGDFTINGKEGEAFNVASSFYKGKLNSTRNKWKENVLTYILINGDVFDEVKEIGLDARIVKVTDWDKG